MVSLFQRFDFSYPDGFLFYDHSGAIARRLADVFPGLYAKDTSLKQRDFADASGDVQMFFGVVSSHLRSSTPGDEAFSEKASAFFDIISKTLEISQIDDFSFRQVLGQTCPTNEAAQSLMWPLIGEEQKTRMAQLSPLPYWSALQSEFTQGSLAFEARIAVMDLLPHSLMRIGTGVSEKMQRLIFPKIQLAGATVEEAIEFLRVKSRELDVLEQDVTKRGVTIDFQPGEAPSGASLTLDLHDVPLWEALRYVTELAGMKLKIAPDRVLVVPRTDGGFLPHITFHFQATGLAPISVADFDVSAFINNMRGRHSQEILAKLAPHLVDL